MTSPLPLDGVRVIDFTRVLAGPFCTMLLADLGADVIKIESFDGDETRAWGPPFDARGRSAYYLSVNRNKRGIVLDLKHPDGRALARDLAAQSHILVENFRVGGMAAFGLDAPTLHAVNPALVYASITGFGQTGPYADRPGYDFVVQAMSGLMSITGTPDGEPTKVGVAVSDVFAGMFACTSILAALRHAERTGTGQHLDISLLDSQIAALVNVASNALVSGGTPRRYGSAHPNIVPYQPFHASDGMFALAVGNDRQFAALCGAVGHAEWATDARFSTNPARVQQRATLIPLLESAFATDSADGWIARCLDAGIPAGRINSVLEALDDPHVSARGLIQSIDDVALIGHPVGFSTTPPTIRLAPPGLGEHTDAVLRDRLGLSADAIARLRRSRAVG
ncbi:MAG: CoA transferase [Chloroflexota bacterium]|nr:CoA transferase [Chloroflexota bacterium]